MGLNLLSPNLALFLCMVFIFCLFWAERRRELPVSSALWLPTIWMTLAGSRPLALWVARGGISDATGFEDASSLNTIVYSTLILAGLFILSQRKSRFNISGLIAANGPLFLLLCYYALAIFWADSSFFSFKRYIRMFGVLIMALIILTEADPILAIRTAARRCGFILLPLSLTLAKYFEAGVTYDPWTGARAVIGAAQDKNMLGQVCLVLGLFYLWDLMLQWKDRFSKPDRLILIIDVSILLLAIHLLLKAHSGTSFVCLIFGSVILLVTKYNFIRRRIGLYFVMGSLIFLFLNSAFDLIGTIAIALGKDPTLTGRTEIWSTLMSTADNAWIGSGYESFWSSSHVLKILETRHIDESHNGYLEIYLNTGLVGLSLFSIFIFSVYRHCAQILRSKPEYGRFVMAVFFSALLYNVAEAAFKGHGFLYFVFLTIALRLPETNSVRLFYGVRARAPGLPVSSL